MPAPRSPMAAPPLPLRNEAEWDTCEHAYPAELCPGRDGPHPDLPPATMPDAERNMARLCIYALLVNVLTQPTAFGQVQA